MKKAGGAHGGRGTEAVMWVGVAMRVGVMGWVGWLGGEGGEVREKTTEKGLGEVECGMRRNEGESRREVEPGSVAAAVEAERGGTRTV